METDKLIAFFNEQIKKIANGIKNAQKQITVDLAVIQAFKNEVNRLNKIKNK